MDSYYLEKQLMGEVQEAIRVKELNVELLEHLSYTAHWILDYCERNNTKLPDLDKLVLLTDRSRRLINTCMGHIHEHPTIFYREMIMV